MFVLFVFLGASVASFVIAILGRRSVREAALWAPRGGLIVMFTVTGVTHFVVLRDDLIAMVPPVLPAPGLLVTITGVLELAGAAGLLLRQTAAWAAGGLGMLLVAMFPANVYAASVEATLAGTPVTPILPRAGMQVLYLTAAIVVCIVLRGQALRWSAVTEMPIALRTARGPAATGPAGVVMLSRLELRSTLHIPGFLLAALRLRRALRKSPGAVSLDLAMVPARRTFWTWSAWLDAESLSRFAGSDLHESVMRRYRERLSGSTFQTRAASAGPRNWADARQQLTIEYAAQDAPRAGGETALPPR